jgi:Flp pilus assembly protein TadB
MDPEQLVTALLAAVITALLTAFGVWLKDRLQHRDEQHRRRIALADAREQVGFIQAWMEVHDRVAPDSLHEQARARAQWDLQQAYATASRSLAVPTDEREPFTVRRMVTSLLLLQLRTGQAKVARVIYYFGLAWALTLAAAGTDITAQHLSFRTYSHRLS